MSWLPWRRPSPAPQVASPSPAVEESEPAPPKTSLLEKIAKWQAVYAAERQGRPTAQQIEQARDAAQARRQEEAEEEFARSVARRGVAWPGESADSDGPSSQSGPFAWMGASAEAARLRDLDWPRQARERQGEDGA